MKLYLPIYTLLCAFWLAPASADEPPGGDLASLLDYAREHNPELAATRFEYEAAQQRTGSSGALPDPVLRTELMDITRQGSQNPSLLPSRAGGTRYLLMQSIPSWGRRDSQRDLATAQAMQAESQTASSWAELASRIKTDYAMAYYLAASERLAQQMLALLENLEQVVTARYANGLGSQQDVIRVQLETTGLHSELITLQSERHHTHARLNSLLSRPVNAPLAEPLLPRTLPSPAQLDETALLERLRVRNPQLQIAEAQARSASKSRELAYSERYPGFTVGIASNQDSNAMQSWDLMLELNIPLQQSARRSQEREAEAMLSATIARKQAALNQLESALSENLTALEAARQTETLLATRLLPQSELTWQSALAGYETGKVDFAMLIDAQRQTLQARQQQLKAQFEAQARLADIERLLGEEL